MPEKKRQHYVPRLLLRRFSADETTVSVAVVDKEFIFHGASIKEQCYEHYFYGADGRVEAAFEGTETQLRTIMGDLAEPHLQALGERDIADLRTFAFYQSQRTLAAANRTGDLAETMMKARMSGDGRLEGIDLDAFRIRMTNPQYLTLFAAICALPLVSDLAASFVLASRGASFVVGDHPAVLANQFGEGRPEFAGLPLTGLATLGLQLFLPLSPRVTFALYDPTTYAYGGSRSKVCHAGSRDVHALNRLQVLNAESCFYFDARRTPDVDARRLARLGQGRSLEPIKHETPLRKRAAGLYSKFVFVQGQTHRLETKLSFIREHVPPSVEVRGGVPVRSVELIDVSNQWSAFLQRKGKEASSRSS